MNNAENTEQNLPKELAERKISENERVKNHLLDFNEYLDRKKKEKTRSDYLVYTAGFYEHAYIHNNRIVPIDFSQDISDLDDAKEELTDYIKQHSKSVEYGIKAYLDFVKEEGSSIEGRNAGFLRDQIHGVGDKTKEVTQEDKIGKKVRSRDTVDTVIEKAPDHTRSIPQEDFHLFLRVMYDTAGRVRDVLKLRWSDFDRNRFKSKDIEEDQIFISSSRSKSTNSGVVNLRSKTFRMLQDYRDREDIDSDPESQIFFQDRERGPWPTEDDQRYYDRILAAMQRAALKYCGIGVDQDDKLGTHDFRHSRLVHLGEKMLDDGHSYPEVEERLQSYGRHDDKETTEIYIGILKSRDEIDLRQYDEE